MSSTSRYRSRIQPSACGGGLILSPDEVNTMIGEVMLRTSKVTPSRDCNWLRVSLSPMKRLSTRNCSSSPFRLDEIAPPLFELEITLTVRVDLGIDLVLLAPEPIRRTQDVEVQNQPGSVERSVAEVAGQGGEPTAAEQAAGIAHRVLPVHALPDTTSASRRSSKARTGPAAAWRPSASGSPPGNCQWRTVAAHLDGAQPPARKTSPAPRRRPGIAGQAPASPRSQ